MLIDEIKNIQSTRTELKKFGITIGIALIVLGTILFLLNKPLSGYLLYTGAAILLVAFMLPQALWPLQKLWMTFAVVMGWFMTRLILSVLFYLILTPIALIARLCGHRFLDLKIDNNTASYWHKREPTSGEPTDYEKQF